MKKGYHLQNNNHALKQLNVSVDIPDIYLGIGFAETHEFMTFKLHHVSKSSSVITPHLDELPVEQATLDQQGNIFNENDFPRYHFLGNEIGGGNYGY